MLNSEGLGRGVPSVGMIGPLRASLLSSCIGVTLCLLLIQIYFVTEVLFSFEYFWRRDRTPLIEGYVLYYRYAKNDIDSIVHVFCLFLVF